MDLDIEKLTNVISNYFAKIENRIEELTLHFGRIHDQLYELCEVVSSNSIQFVFRNNGTGIACGSDLYLKDDYDSTSTSCDNIFGANLETQEVTLNNAFVTPLLEYLVPTSYKHRIAQVIPATYPLISSQVMYQQSDTYKTLGRGKPLSYSLIFWICDSHNRTTICWSTTTWVGGLLFDKISLTMRQNSQANNYKQALVGRQSNDLLNF